MVVKEHYMLLGWFVRLFIGWAETSFDMSWVAAYNGVWRNVLDNVNK